MAQRQPQAKRGFTTLQLLEIAGLITDNYARRSGLPEVQQNINFVSDHLSRALGLNLSPAPGVKLRAKFIKYLAPKAKKDGSRKAGSAQWFADGSQKNAYRAISPEGQAIEAARARIYDYVQRNAAYVLDPNNYALATAGGVARPTSSASHLDNILTSSFSWGSLKKGRTAADRIAAFKMVWAMTDANQEPPALAREGVGAAKPASVQQAMENVNQSSGFLSSHVQKVLLELMSDARTRSTTRSPLSGTQIAARQRTAAALRQILGLQAGGTVAQMTAAAAPRLASPQAIHQVFTALVNAVGGLDGLWAALGKSQVKALLSGQAIYQPINPQNGKKEFFYVEGANSQNADPINNAAGFTKAVYVSLGENYIRQGASGDRRSEAAQKAASSRRPRENRGLTGLDDPIFKKLSLQAPANVAKFVRKALQGGYSMPALRAGAQLLQAPVDANTMLHAAVAQVIADHVVRQYAAAVDAGNAGAIQAVAAALKIKGLSKVRADDAGAIAGARAAIIRHLDAEYGRLTGDCTKLTKAELKSVARAAGVSVTKGETIAATCARIGGSAVAPSPQVSSGREERTKPYTAPAGGSSKSRKKKSVETGILQGLISGAAPGPQSPRLQQPTVAAPFGVSPTTGRIRTGQSPGLAGTVAAQPLVGGAQTAPALLGGGLGQTNALNDMFGFNQ